jgi:hypothetical protein
MTYNGYLRMDIKEKIEIKRDIEEDRRRLNRRKKYPKRSVMKWKYKGVWRGLLWKKVIYEEWFEFCKIARSYPNDFGIIENDTSFREWWLDVGGELFYEKPSTHALTIVDDITDPTGDFLYVKITRNVDVAVLKKAFKTFVSKYIEPIKTISSTAAYFPSKECRFIHVKKLREYRYIYQCMDVEGLSVYDTVKSIHRQKWFKDNVRKRLVVVLEDLERPKYKYKYDKLRHEERHLNDLLSYKYTKAEEYNILFERRVHRGLKQAREIISNVRLGVFP